MGPPYPCIKMPANPDNINIVQVYKQESAAHGGSEEDFYPGPVPINAPEDGIEAAALFLVEDGDIRPLRTRSIWSDGGHIRFKDPDLGEKTLRQLYEGSGTGTPGDDITYEENLAESSTSGTAWIEKVRATIYPSETKQYEITVSSLYSCSDLNVQMFVRTQVDNLYTYFESGDELSGTAKYQDGLWKPYAGNFILELAVGTHYIDMDFKSGTSGKTVYIKDATITVRRIDN